MRWIILLFLGMALGAGALFTYLREVGDDDSAALPPPQRASVARPALNPAGAIADPADIALPQPTTQPGELPAGAPASDPATAPAGTAPAASPAAVEPNTDPHLPTGQSASATHEGKLLIPVEGIKLAQLSDTFEQPRGAERRHEALDIMAAKGAKVLAVADGKVSKLFNSKPGGLTVYQFDPSEKFSYYYAHLDRYADNLKEGQAIKRGDLIGYVGVTGNSDPKAPHLHFGVFELPATKEWWKGKPVNPFPLMQQ